MKKIYFISLVLVILAVSVGIFSYFEFSKTQEDLDKLVESESSNILQSLKHSIENNIKSNELIRQEMTSALISTTTLASHLNEHEKFTETTSIRFIKDYDIDIIIIIDDYQVVSNIPDIQFNDFDFELKQELEYLEKEKYIWLELGIYEIKGIEYYLIGGYFSQTKTITIAGLKADILLNLRQSVGIGKLLNDYSRNPEIVYVILQDTFSVIAASRYFGEISKISDDEFLLNLYNHKDIAKRNINYNNEEIIESSVRIDIPEEDILLRLGISLEKVKAIQNRNASRTVFLSLGLFFVVAIAIGLVYQRSKHIKLKEEHRITIEYTRRLLENTDDAVVVIDNNYNLIIFNKKAEELFGKSINISNYNILFSNDLLLLRTTIDNRRGIQLKEIEFNKDNARRKFLAVSTSLVENNKANSLFAIAIIRDITLLKEAEDYKLRNEKLTATSELAAGVAHEIRNPMNSINVIAQRLELEFEPKEYADEYYNLVTTIRQSIKRIDRIIAQFLAFSRMNPPVLKKLELNNVINRAVDLLKHSANKQNIKIINNFHSDVYVMLDSDKIEQVFINLLQNAIDAIGSNGTITIEQIITNDNVMVSIEDTGKGIKPDIRHKIFDLYFTTKEKGMGLGLGIVNKIILEHNAKIRFESYEGSGTVFFIEFKRIQQG